MKLKVFIVFHQAFDERLVFPNLTRPEIDEFFTLYGVNESHARKQVIRLDGSTDVADGSAAGTLLEYKLGWYDPTIQSRGYMETSCYVHLLKNRLHEQFDYIGVTQYDMLWRDPAVAVLRQLAREPAPGRNIVYGMPDFPFVDAMGRYHRNAYPGKCNFRFLLESYNRFFDRGWDESIFVHKPLALWQTFLMPREEFTAMASWLAALCEELYPWANQPPYETHWGALSGKMERAQAVFIAARLAEGRIRFEYLGLLHDLEIAAKLAIARLHYGEIVR